MIIYFYLFIPFLFATTDSSSIRGRNNKNDLVPFMGSRSDPEKKDNTVKTVGSEPFFVHILPSSGRIETRGKDKKKKRLTKKRISKIKALRKKQRTRRELHISKPTPTEDELPNPLDIPKTVNAPERPQNLTNAISRKDILKALSTSSKKTQSKRSNNEDLNIKDEKRNYSESGKYTALTRNHPKHILSEQTPLIKMVYPSTPKSDRHPHKYTYRDLVTDRERLEQKINYIKNMLNVNDSVVDDAIRVRRRSDSDRTANRIAKMFLTLSAMNGLQDKRKSKCEQDYDDDDRVQDVWGKERKESSSRKSSSSNEERYKVKKWIEFMKKKRSYGKTCPCMASYGEERDVFPLEQKLPKGYLLMERRDSSEESSETYRDPLYSSREKPNRDSNFRRRLNKNQDDQETNVKGSSKNGKKKPDTAFTDLELYRSRAKQILRNAEEILDRIKEEEEKRLSVPNLFMSQLRELTSRIQGDSRNNENDLIRKLQKNLGWGSLTRSEEGTEGNQFMENVKSFILDPYEKAKALTDESTKRLSSYLLRNLGKIQEASEEQAEAKEGEDEVGEANLQVYFGRVPPKEDEKPLPDNLAKESQKVPKDTEKTDTDKEEPYKQKTEDIIKEQQKILDEYKMTQDSEESRKEMEKAGDKETETVRENQHSNLEDKTELQLKEYNTDRNSDSREKAIKSGEVQEKVRPDFVEGKASLHPEGGTQGEEAEDKGTASRDMQTEENVQKAVFEEFLKVVNEDTNEVPEDHENVETLRSDRKQDSKAQTGEELVQRIGDKERANEQEEMQEIAASPKKASEELSERNENDVASSPHLRDDHDFLNIRENNENVDDDTSNGSDPYVQGNGEEPSQTGSNDEAVLEAKENVATGKSEAELSLNRSKEISDFESKETVALEEPVSENSNEGNESPREEKLKAIEGEDGAKQQPEYADLVKEVSEEVPNVGKTSDASPDKLKNEREETNKEILNMEHPGNEDEPIDGERIDRANKDGEIFLKLASDIPVLQKPEENDQEDFNGILLKVNADENSKELETEELIPGHDNQDREFIEINDETPLEAENLETPKEESSEETFLEEALESGTQSEEKDEVSLGAGIHTEDAESQELAKNAEEESKDGTLLKVKKTQNSEALEAINDETDLGEEIFEEENNRAHKNEANEEDSVEKALKTVRDETLEEVDQTLKARNPNKEDSDDPETLHKFSAEAMPKNEEETLKSEYVANSESNQENQEEKESLQETISGEMPEEREQHNEENTKFNKFTEQENENREMSESLEKDQESMEGETVLIIGDPNESSITEENEDVDKESALRAENFLVKAEDETEETNREVQTSDSQKNLEESYDETSLQKSNPEEKTEEYSNDKLKAVLENETQDTTEDMEGDEAIKAANPDDNDQKINEEFSEDGEESVKAVLEGDEEVDAEEETLKAQMENDEDAVEDDAELIAETLVEKVQGERNSNEDRENESVSAVFDEENQENFEESDNLKAVKSEEGDDVGRAASENSENVDADETILKDETPNEELEQDETLLGNKEGAEDFQENTPVQTENEDEIPLREALGQENLEEEEEALQSERPNGEDEQKQSSLKSVSGEDESDNKIDYESPLRSSVVQTVDPDYNKNSIEEVLREENNEIDEKDETIQSENFDTRQSGEDFNEDDQEIFMEGTSRENPEEEDYSTLEEVNPEAQGEAQEIGSQIADLLQIPESSSKTFKGSALKVPKSIGKIMNDLELKAKDDIISIQNLNPDKIDHIIDKIDEAEQKNLLESQETDCMKECACAEEMNTRSRNIGRYEIVKDFLHWMKDLQLNRVLSDD